MKIEIKPYAHNWAFFNKNHIPYLTSEYWVKQTRALPCTHNIWCDGKLVGFLDCSLNYPYKRSNVCQIYIEMVEILEKCRGQGVMTAFIKKLFDEPLLVEDKQYNVISIAGESLSKAIPFWYNKGANFEVSTPKLYNNYKCGYSAAFYLSKRSFNASMNSKFLI